jgi:small conductance mechanosensitive channel
MMTTQDLNSKNNLLNIDYNIIYQKITYLIHVFFETLPNLFIGIIIFILLMMVSRIVRHVIINKLKVHQSLKILFERLSYMGFLFAGILIFLAIVFPSIKPVDLLGGVGIVSLAIGFAVKDILNNFLSGILILLQEPFRVKDEISHNGLEGVVDSIHIRYTILIGYDGRKYLIPNGDIYANMIIVNTLSKCRESNLEITFDSKYNLEEKMENLLKIIKEVDEVYIAPPATVLISNLTVDSFTLKCSWSTSPYREAIVSIRNKVLKKIHQELIIDNNSNT